MSCAQAVSSADRLKQTAGMGRPVSFIRGVGPAKGALLAKIGVRSVFDELMATPMRYLDLSQLVDVAHARVGDQASFVVHVDKV